MKIGTLLLALLLVVGFIAAQKFLFQERYEIDLTAEALKICAQSSDFDQVEVAFDGLDGTLTGTVPTLEARLDIQQRINNLKGARLPDTNNHLQIPARVDATRSGKNLALSGYLPGPELQSRITSFIKARRPDLELDTAGLVIDQHVADPGFPEADNFPGYLEPLWQEIREPAHINIIKTGPAYAVEGLLPSADWKNLVLGAITSASPGTTLNDNNLRTGDHANDPGFLKEVQLANFLRACFVLPAPGSVRLSADSLAYGGKATHAQTTFVDQYAADLGYSPEQITTDFEVFPTIYHVPEYRLKSALEPAALKQLRNALDLAAVDFKMGSAQLPDEQLSKIDAAAAAIAQAGDTVKIVIGGYTIPGGDAAQRDLARKRALEIINRLVERGTPESALEIVDFGPSQTAETDPGDLKKRVELLVK
jgi:outer membrane protein OmpA-like peptidoglycan-associated protein